MSQDNFQWTDELVQEFYKYCYSNVFKQPTYPEEMIKKFKEEKTKRDWEVISFTAFDGKMYHNSKGIESQICEKDTITSVRRLSDGEVFSIGDEVEWGHCKGAHKISRIGLDGSWLKFEGEEPCRFTFILQGLKKVVKPKPLFVTEDVVEVFEGGHCWIVQEGARIPMEWDSVAKESVSLSEKYFAEKIKAEEYILNNKPLLSVNDIKEYIEKYFDYKGGINVGMIRELAKQKLSK